MRFGTRRFAATLAAVIAAALMAGTTARADEAPGEEVVVDEDAAPAASSETTETTAEGEFVRRGLYLAGGPAYMSPLFSGAAEPIGGGWGMNARVGYRFLDHLAVETVYEWSQFSETPLGGNITLTSNVVTVDAKLIYPFGRFQPFLGGGVGVMTTSQTSGGFWDEVDLSGTAFAGRIDWGIDVFLTEGWSAYADATWLLPSGELSDLQYIAARFGVRYTF